MPKTEILHVAKLLWITNVPNTICCIGGGKCVGGTDHPFSNDFSTQNLAIHCPGITAYHQRLCFLRTTF